MKCKLSETNPSSCTKVSVPDDIHFVWIGDVGKINCEYINIWQRSNQSKTINLWLDQNTFSCGYLLNCIQKLPAGTQWVALNGERYQGGECITVDAPLETIPVFIRAGSALVTLLVN